MKTLILITGREEYLKTTLEGLRNTGNYKGDIVLVRLEMDKFSEDFIKWLSLNNVTVQDQHRVYFYLDLNALYVLNITLKELQSQYDVVMLLHDDMIIQKDINQLFEIAYNNKEVSMVYEESGGMCHKIQDWWENRRMIESYDFTKEPWWNNIKDSNVWNPAFIIGTPKAVIHFIDFLFSFMERHSICGLQEILPPLYKFIYPERLIAIDKIWFFYEENIDGKIVAIRHLLTHRSSPMFNMVRTEEDRRYI